jgi:hypothetical protein
MGNTKSLRLTFLNDQGKKKNLLVAEPAENLNADQVRAAMTTIRDANVFGDEEGDYYKTIDSAAYIERTVRSLFGSGAAKSEETDKENN